MSNGRKTDKFGLLLVVPTNVLSIALREQPNTHFSCAAAPSPEFSQALPKLRDLSVFSAWLSAGLKHKSVTTCAICTMGAAVRLFRALERLENDGVPASPSEPLPIASL